MIERRGIFSYDCVVVATNNFSLESKLGEGGFGSVYMVSSKQIFKKRWSN